MDREPDRKATAWRQPRRRADARGRGVVLVLVVCGLAGAACAPEGPIELPEPVPGNSPVVYPLDLWDARVEGETILMVHVTETGTVDSAYIDQSSGLEEFDSAAIQGGRLMRFTPGEQGGERRPMWTRLPVRFRREATDASSSTEPPGPRS